MSISFKGFTLIELLIVIAIIQRYTAKTKFVSAYTTLRSITGKSLLRLAEYGNCVPNGSGYGTRIPIPGGKVITSFSYEVVLPAYEGCVLIAYFRPESESGFAKFSGRKIRDTCSPCNW